MTFDTERASAGLTLWQMWQMPRASGLRGPPEVEIFFSQFVAKAKKVRSSRDKFRQDTFLVIIE